MQLTTQTDYCLRTLMYLATREERATIQDVAALFQISVHHVAKVVTLLNRLGYIRSIRGIGGGIELARRPEEIRVGEVIARVEGNTHLLSCVGTDRSCIIDSFCKLKGVLAEAERIQQEYLNSVTLADVAPSQRRLNRI
ncbi:RrF2 family transcriptional regulator [Rubinisphaera margarita]|uniref:RrF2 family transcriptional regulator n=1 Tax=Rubinisphaera margarita TaxID=2909586 RepID=UPI001EE95431|nr:Rrf2 family transcriptional regulator [Rubinisphaera margarita]MCG6158100.1 Rrf2 family transcriptional regulator [Rubinisphaera margarita]